MKAYIVAAKRTPVGSFNGVFKTTGPAKLGSEAIKAAISQAGIDVHSIDEVIVGNVVSAGQGMGIGRQAAISAGLPYSVPAYSLNMVCASGMKSIMDACSHIKAGDADVVIAAGAENMSQIPFAGSSDIRSGVKFGNIEMRDLLIHDGLTDVFNSYHMGITAENIADKYHITREQQDRFALNSQKRALAAIESGKFRDEIATVDVATKGGGISVFQDEYPKADASADKLEKLRPAFKKEGTVTAGNSSGINDGASAVIIVSEDALKKYGLTPLAEIVGYAQTGNDPAYMGMGPVKATQNALQKAGLKLKDVALCECNEAFAGQSLGVIKALADAEGISENELSLRTNVNGGAIALGHPLGASGNRIVVTLLYEMLRKKVSYGLATICVGGGMGTAIILKNVSQ